MTVRDEVMNHAEYERLRFPEFLEFLGRVAHTKYYEDKESPSHEKIESILDEIFPVYGCKRKRPNADDAEDESSSDSLLEKDDE